MTRLRVSEKEFRNVLNYRSFSPSRDFIQGPPILFPSVLLEKIGCFSCLFSNNFLALSLRVGLS